MDRDRFDALARLLASRGSRRGALGALVGAVLFGQHGDDGLAKRRKGKDPGNGRRRGGDGKDRGKRRDKERGKNRARQARAEAVPSSCCSTGNCAPGPGKNLSNCCYLGQNLTRKNFKGANLSGADFDGATLTGANFRAANLSNACFAGADLRGITVDNSTNLNGAIFCRTQTNRGEDNSGCGLGTPCCPACDAANPCDDGQICCNGRCRDSAGEPACCAAGDCPERVCQTRTCTGFQCVYTPVTGGSCPAPGGGAGACCNGVCCAANQICDTRPNPDVCCTPDTRNQTCGVGTQNPRCGQVTNNCGQPVNCGDCAPVTCRVVACRDTICTVTGNQANLTACTTAAGTPGVCCDGACVAGNCCGNADCTGSSNTCIGNQCRCGAGRACTEPAETCCGAGAQGVCIDTTANPTNCGSCGNVCPNGRCVAGQCADCTSSANCGQGRVCCGGQCFTGDCCALRGRCGTDAPCCASPNAPDRGCCIGRGTAEERCCLISPVATLPPTVCGNGDCCTDICLAGVPGSRLCGPRNLTTCPG